MAEDCVRTPRFWALIGVCIVEGVLFISVVPLRLYVRLRITKAFGWDDVAISIAYLACLTVFVLVFVSIPFGLGVPAVCYTDIDKAVTVFKYIQIVSSLALFSMMFARASVALLLIRIFSVKRTLRYLLYGWTIFMFAQQCVVNFIAYGYCRPAQALWDPRLRETAQCWSANQVRAINLFNGIIGASSDFLLAFLSIYMVQKLALSLRRKILVGGLLALGLIPGCCAIGRTILQVITSKLDTSDLVIVLFLFGSAEMTALIVCASVPVIPLAWQRTSKSSSQMERGPIKDRTQPARDACTARVMEQEERNLLPWTKKMLQTPQGGSIRSKTSGQTLDRRNIDPEENVTP